MERDHILYSSINDILLKKSFDHHRDLVAKLIHIFDGTPLAHHCSDVSLQSNPVNESNATPCSIIEASVGGPHHRALFLTGPPSTN